MWGQDPYVERFIRACPIATHGPYGPDWTVRRWGQDHSRAAGIPCVSGWHPAGKWCRNPLQRDRFEPLPIGPAGFGLHQSLSVGSSWCPSGVKLPCWWNE